MSAFVGTEDAQFENVNELRMFPFSDDSSLVDSSGKELPLGIISDVHIVVPKRSNAEWPVVRLSSVHVSSAMVSACFVSSCGGVADALSVTVSASSFMPYYPYRLEKLCGSSDIGGVVSFGDIRDAFDPETYFLENAFIHKCCVAVKEPAGVRMFVDKRSGETLSGDVNISFSGYLKSVREGKNFRIEMEDGASSELASECSKITGSEACGATSVKSINGIRPDDEGNIVIWFH